MPKICAPIHSPRCPDVIGRPVMAAISASIAFRLRSSSAVRLIGSLSTSRSVACRRISPPFRRDEGRWSPRRERARHERAGPASARQGVAELAALIACRSVPGSRSQIVATPTGSTAHTSADLRAQQRMAPWSAPCADLGDRRGCRRSVTPVSGKGAGCRAPWSTPALCCLGYLLVRGRLRHAGCPCAGGLMHCGGLPAGRSTGCGPPTRIAWWCPEQRRFCVHEARAARADRTVSWRP